MPFELCDGYYEPRDGFMGFKCARLATRTLVGDDQHEYHLCDQCWEIVQDPARRDRVRLWLRKRERYWEPSMVYAPYVPQQKGDDR